MGFVWVEITNAAWYVLDSYIIFIGTILSWRKKSLTSITYSLHAQLMSEDDEKEISLFNTG
jgi:hypothetical protein